MKALTQNEFDRLEDMVQLFSIEKFELKLTDIIYYYLYNDLKPDKKYNDIQINKLIEIDLYITKSFENTNKSIKELKNLSQKFNA